MPDKASRLLGRAARRYGLVACISGRAAADARRLVGVGGIAYAGSHGAELLEPGATRARISPAFESWAGRVADFVADRDDPELRRLRIRIERKGPIVAFHWRGVPDEDAARTRVEGIAREAEAAGLDFHWGRKVLEVRPPVPVDKGQAVRELVERSGVRIGALRRRRCDRPRCVRRARLAGSRRQARRGGQDRRPLGGGPGRDRRAGRSGRRRHGRLRRGSGSAARRMRFPDFLRTSVSALRRGGHRARGGGDRRRRRQGRPHASLRRARLVGHRRRRGPVARPPARGHAGHRPRARRRTYSVRPAGARARSDPLQPAVGARAVHGRLRGGRVPRSRRSPRSLPDT